MTTDEFDIDKLRDYLLGKLGDEELIAFQTRMENEPEFKKEAIIHTAILAGIEQHFDHALKQRLQHEERKPWLSIKKALWLAIAASVTITLVVAFLFLFDRPGGPDLFQQYYKPYYNVISHYRRGDETKTDTYDVAFQFYERKEYQEAIQNLGDLLKDHPNDQNLQFYLGLSYLAIGKSNSASLHLKKIAQSDHKLAEPAAWYLGLSYLQADDQQNATVIFSEIVKNNSSYRQRAQEILEKLE